MGRLFKIEMKKLQKSTAMLVMVIVAAALGLLSVGINALLDMLTEGMVDASMSLSGYNIANSMSFGNSDIMLMVIILMAVLIGGDFSARTLQTQVAAGYNRFLIILSRFMSGMVAYLFLYIIYFIVTVGGVTILYGWGENIGSSEGLKHLGEIFAQFGLSTLLAFTMIAFYMLFIFLLRSVGGSIGVCVPFMLFGTSILQTVMMFSEDARKVLAYTPFGQEYELLMSGNTMLYESNLNEVQLIVVCLVWIAALLGLTFVSFRKSELK
ncbi:MAG: ABC transporter permease subunit [Lachnospiraceae bacterium]|nr:ABC transporter permease subunit [Lachnospiraceae bacterium]